jgi:hypothetical protein
LVHTAESPLDLNGPDAGAEGVASFISRRTDAAGSYHLIGDRDSIVPMVPLSYEAFGDGTGSNPWAIHLSLAMHAADWPSLSTGHRDELLDTLAQMAAIAAEWLWREHRVRLHPRRLTKAESDAGLAGFIAHGDRDPGRRSDPGPGFPWALFLDRYAARAGEPRPNGGTTMPDRTKQISDWQGVLLSYGAELGSTGPGGDGRDGDFGPRTLAASIDVLEVMAARADSAEARADVTEARVALLEARVAELEAGNVPPDDTAVTDIGRVAVDLFRSLPATFAVAADLLNRIKAESEAT